MQPNNYSDALAASRTIQAGKTEQDKHWEALERRLTGHLPIPIAVTEEPEWANRKLAQEVRRKIIALQKLATELVHNKEERGRWQRVQRKEHLIEQTQTLN